MKKEVILACFIIISIAVILVDFIYPKYWIPLTGNGLYGDNGGFISLTILPATKAVYIYSPQNITYYFGVGENYVLDLNVSANFPVNTWWYKLEDLRHNVTVNQSVIFTPNSTFTASRWGNRITVYANDSAGAVTSASVTFYISSPNTAPFFEELSPNLFACENSWLSYKFNATDLDEDALEFDINPKNPIFIWDYGKVDWNTERAEIFSVYVYKSRVGDVLETVSVSDGTYVAVNDTLVRVIEVNNPPSISNIGVQTVWTQGDNNTFYYDVGASDAETPVTSLIFNLTFKNSEPVFGISNLGIMNFTPNSSQIGVYNLSLCVNDTGLASPHPNISLCGQDGSSLGVCKDFSLTVTNQNRPPTIINYYPQAISFNATDYDVLFFNITKYDPDGTIPDAYWYVDGSLREYDAGSSYDNFTFSFGCGIIGTHTIQAEITDGLLTDSVAWLVDVKFVACPPPAPPEPSGGLAIGPFCFPKWACAEWSVCQNSKIALEVGSLAKEDYRSTAITCGLNFWKEENCGYQIRACFDVNKCNRTIGKPAEIQACEYTELPGCFDGIKNCHDDACELLIDCGGPCKACPTCSDKIRNQGETGIDCGGPCPWKCPPETPLKRALKDYLKWLLLAVIIALVAVLLVKAMKIKKIKQEIKEYE